MKARRLVWRVRLVLGAVMAVAAAPAWGAEVPPLVLDHKISLGDVRGRIDHMAVDLPRHRLFVAALGNNSLAVVDLVAKRLDRLIGGFPAPQGIGYDPSTDTLLVANAGDGSVRLLKDGDLSPMGRIELGSDADNVRIDSKAGQAFVGYGDGALAVIDLSTHGKIADVPLKAHPESFQLEESSTRIFVNLPDAGTIGVIDRITRHTVSSWPTRGRSANFAMTLDQVHERLVVAFRRPAELGIFSLDNGAPLSTVSTCGDVDDLFVDPKRDRIYVSCGEGFVDVLAVRRNSYERIDRIPTAPGARTSLFVAELDRLLLAVPARGDNPAAIWVFRPSP